MKTYKNNDISLNPGKVTGKFKTILIWAGVFIAFFVVGYLLLSSLSVAQIRKLDQSLMDLSPGFLLFRWALFLLLMFYWRSVIAWLARKKQWSEAHRSRIINNRWQLIALFITLELLFNHRSYLTLVGM